jgi:hypothetical protein
MAIATQCLIIAPVLCLLAAFPAHAGPCTISIQAPAAVLNNAVSRAAIDDALNLLRRAFGPAAVTLNAPLPSVRLVLPSVTPSRDTCVPAPSVRPYLCTAIPDQSFSWRSRADGATITLTLAAANPDAVAAGLYALLQEKLGFRFYHPREGIIPRWQRWPLPVRFTFSGAPRFEKRGFHLHTLHPIELTDQLHDPDYPGGWDDIRAYLDWLARNGQNTFQFFLLRGVDRNRWPAHARRIVEYAHRRGIRCGIEISMAMIQQQAFQAITLLRPYPSYQEQSDESLAWLFQAPWDYVSFDATMGEHLPFLDRMFPDVQMHIEQQVEKRYGARLLYATHVICAREGDKVRRPRLPNSGIMLHTVMCYSASEEKAPVYGNVNQRFMLEAARIEAGRRETWYWPESSYWVAFDSSVPLLLLPYLESRWRDSATMRRIGVSGHLTFSSGWEWGYWLVEWSMARWTWEYADNGRIRGTSPLSRLNELFSRPFMRQTWREALELQNRYLKERELLRYMSALAPFSELPHPFDKPFQPAPPFPYSRLLTDAGAGDVAMLMSGPIPDMEAYAARMHEIVSRLQKGIIVQQRRGIMPVEEIRLAEELVRGLEVTALRARHRALTLRALISKRKERSEGSRDNASEALLKQAVAVRNEALGLVRLQEKMYRYPVERIGRRHAGLTAYRFGYLYPVSCLFFWEREEEQVRRGRFDAFFMKLWDFRRTIGLESLIYNR